MGTYKQHIWVGTFDTENDANAYWYPDEYLRAWEKELGLELARCDLTTFYEEWEARTKDSDFKSTPFYDLITGLCKEIGGAFTYLEDVEFHFEESNNFEQLIDHIPANKAEILLACSSKNISSANCFLSYGVYLVPNCSPENSKRMKYLGSFPHETPMYLR